MRKKYLIGLVVLLLVCGLFFVRANMKGNEKIPVISTAELKAKIDAGEKLVMINPLSDLLFNEGYIPGSLNIPLDRITNVDNIGSLRLLGLPSDPTTLIVSYCLGPE